MSEPEFDEGPAEAGPAPFAPPIDWWQLDGASRSDTVAELSEFTVQLVASYGLPSSVIAPCWFRHEALVQELLALFQYRNQQQFLEVAPPGAPLEFHYQLNMAIARLTSWTKAAGCTEQEHIDTRIPGWVIPGTDATTAYDAAVESHAAKLLTDNTTTK
jgi:hypothetical protein